MKIKKSLTFVLVFISVFLFYGKVHRLVDAEMPFYALNPKELVLRAQFYTTYSTSTDERKSNVNLASKALNNVMVDVGGEFSFNKTVGERTIRRGYKNAKIIFNGKFIEGIGGGVCQVSSTLYNAVLLAGLEITEAHPHSLPVGYVAPSFDAMVNSGSADLRFINNTNNPIIIKSFADNNRLKIQIYGEPMAFSLERKSVTIGDIPAPSEEILLDVKGEYPELYQGERLVVNYSKKGLKSEGYLIKTKGKKVEYIKIREDVYKPVRGLIILGNVKKEEPIIQGSSFNLNISFINNIV